MTVVGPGVASVPGSPVDIAIDAQGEFTLALGRSADVDAWVGGAAHNTVSGVDAEQGTLLAEHTAGDATVPNPQDSDLWVATQSAEGHLVHQWTEPAEGDWSLLIAADGTQPAPTAVTVSWPNDASTPFAVPLMIIGALLLIFGIAVAVGTRRGGNGGSRPSGRRAVGGTPAPAGGRGFEETAFGTAPTGPIDTVDGKPSNEAPTGLIDTVGEKPSGEKPEDRGEPPVMRRAATRIAAVAAAAALAVLPAVPARPRCRRAPRRRRPPDPPASPRLPRTPTRCCCSPSWNASSTRWLPPSKRGTRPRTPASSRTAWAPTPWNCARRTTPCRPRVPTLTRRCRWPRPRSARPRSPPPPSGPALPWP